MTAERRAALTVNLACTTCTGTGSAQVEKKVGWGPSAEVVYVRELCSCVRPPTALPSNLCIICERRPTKVDICPSCEYLR